MALGFLGITRWFDPNFTAIKEIMHDKKSEYVCNAINFRNRQLAKLKGTLYLPMEESAKKNNISKTQMWNLITSGKCVDAYQVGRKWIVLSTWKYKRVRKAGAKRPAFALKDPSRKD